MPSVPQNFIFFCDKNFHIFFQNKNCKNQQGRVEFDEIENNESIQCFVMGCIRAEAFQKECYVENGKKLEVWPESIEKIRALCVQKSLNVNSDSKFCTSPLLFHLKSVVVGQILLWWHSEHFNSSCNQSQRSCKSCNYAWSKYD